jgi:hypothetical protein
MYLPIDVKSPNNVSKWQMEFNSAFKVLSRYVSDMFWSEDNFNPGCTTQQNKSYQLSVYGKYCRLFNLTRRLADAEEQFLWHHPAAPK